MRRLFLVFALFAAGCSSGPLVRDAPDLNTPAAFPNHSAEQIVALMAATASADSLFSFESQARIAVRSSVRDANLTATIRQRAADTLWAAARGPFGIEVARAQATADSFAVLDKLNGRLYLGPTAAANAFLPAPVGPAELFQTFLGTLRPEPGIAWTVRAGSTDDGAHSSDAGERVYVLTHPDGQHLYFIDPATWRTVRYRGLVGTVVVDERTFSSFDRVEGRVLPRRVEIRNPQEDASLTIEHRKLALNPSPLRFPFSPGNADVRRFD